MSSFQSNSSLFYKVANIPVTVLTHTVHLQIYVVWRWRSSHSRDIMVQKYLQRVDMNDVQLLELITLCIHHNWRAVCDVDVVDFRGYYDVSTVDVQIASIITISRDSWHHPTW